MLKNCQEREREEKKERRLTGLGLKKKYIKQTVINTVEGENNISRNSKQKAKGSQNCNRRQSCLKQTQALKAYQPSKLVITKSSSLTCCKETNSKPQKAFQTKTFNLLQQQDKAQP